MKLQVDKYCAKYHHDPNTITNYGNLNFVDQIRASKISYFRITKRVLHNYVSFKNMMTQLMSRCGLDGASYVKVCRSN